MTKLKRKIEKITSDDIFGLRGEDDMHLIESYLILLTEKLNEIIDKLNDITDRG